MARRVTEPRRKLTPVQKLQIMVRQARCPLCGEKLGTLAATEFDHAQALVNGGADELENFQAVHAGCHDKKTHGPGGERRVTTAGSDRHIADKVDRLSDEQTEFRSRMLAPKERAPSGGYRGPSGLPAAQRRGRASAPLNKTCNPPFPR